MSFDSHPCWKQKKWRVMRSPNFSFPKTLLIALLSVVLIVSAAVAHAAPQQKPLSLAGFKGPGLFGIRRDGTLEKSPQGPAISDRPNLARMARSSSSVQTSLIYLAFPVVLGLFQMANFSL